MIELFTGVFGRPGPDEQVTERKPERGTTK
jgi:hypothetical protein